VSYYMKEVEWLKSTYRVYAERIAQLERENAELRRLAAHRAAFIEHHRITTPAHQIALFTDEDERIWDERIQRFMDADRAIINAARKEGILPQSTEKEAFASLTLDALSDASFETKEGGAT